MNLSDLELNLAAYISQIQYFNDDNVIKEKIETLFKSINYHSECLDINCVEVNKSVAKLYAFLLSTCEEKYKISAPHKLQHIYDFLIEGFYNFWKSPKYFNQELLQSKKQIQSCILTSLNQDFCNLLINSYSIQLIRGYLDIDVTNTNDFRNDLFKKILLIYYFNIYGVDDCIQLEIKNAYT